MKKMKPAHLIQLGLAVVATAALAEEKPVFECVVKETKIRVFMSEAEFDPGHHTVERKPGAYGPETLYIDGTAPIGSDNQIPEISWGRFAVSWDDKEVPIPLSLYNSYYHPNIDENAIKNRLLTFTVDPHGDWIQIVMSGSDGGGAYLVGWELRRDGEHRLFDPSRLYRHPS
ncbi:MAG: hypothetical protein AAF236_07145 [Verrucomicrobiota bacterium]